LDNIRKGLVEKGDKNYNKMDFQMENERNKTIFFDITRFFGK